MFPTGNRILGMVVFERLHNPVVPKPEGDHEGAELEPSLDDDRHGAEDPDPRAAVNPDDARPLDAVARPELDIETNAWRDAERIARNEAIAREDTRRGFNLEPLKQSGGAPGDQPAGPAAFVPFKPDARTTGPNKPKPLLLRPASKEVYATWSTVQVTRTATSGRSNLTGVNSGLTGAAALCAALDAKSSWITYSSLVAERSRLKDETLLLKSAHLAFTHASSALNRLKRTYESSPAEHGGEQTKTVFNETKARLETIIRSTSLDSLRYTHCRASSALLRLTFQEKNIALVRDGLAQPVSSINNVLRVTSATLKEALKSLAVAMTAINGAGNATQGTVEVLNAGRKYALAYNGRIKTDCALTWASAEMAPGAHPETTTQLIQALAHHADHALDERAREFRTAERYGKGRTVFGIASLTLGVLGPMFPPAAIVALAVSGTFMAIVANKLRGIKALESKKAGLRRVQERELQSVGDSAAARRQNPLAAIRGLIIELQNMNGPEQAPENALTGFLTRLGLPATMVSQFKACALSIKENGDPDGTKTAALSKLMEYFIYGDGRITLDDKRLQPLAEWLSGALRKKNSGEYIEAVAMLRQLEVSAADIRSIVGREVSVAELRDMLAGVTGEDVNRPIATFRPIALTKLVADNASLRQPDAIEYVRHWLVLDKDDYAQQPADKPDGGKVPDAQLPIQALSADLANGKYQGKVEAAATQAQLARQLALDKASGDKLVRLLVAPNSPRSDSKQAAVVRYLFDTVHESGNRFESISADIGQHVVPSSGDLLNFKEKLLHHLATAAGRKTFARSVDINREYGRLEQTYDPSEIARCLGQREGSVTCIAARQLLLSRNVSHTKAEALRWTILNGDAQDRKRVAMELGRDLFNKAPAKSVLYSQKWLKAVFAAPSSLAASELLPGFIDEMKRDCRQLAGAIGNRPTLRELKPLHKAATLMAELRESIKNEGRINSRLFEKAVRSGERNPAAWGDLKYILEQHRDLRLVNSNSATLEQALLPGAPPRRAREDVTHQAAREKKYERLLKSDAKALAKEISKSDPIDETVRWFLTTQLRPLANGASVDETQMQLWRIALSTGENADRKRVTEEIAYGLTGKGNVRTSYSDRFFRAAGGENVPQAIRNLAGNLEFGRLDHGIGMRIIKAQRSGELGAEISNFARRNNISGEELNRWRLLADRFGNSKAVAADIEVRLGLHVASPHPYSPADIESLLRSGHDALRAMGIRMIAGPDHDGRPIDGDRYKQWIETGIDRWGPTADGSTEDSRNWFNVDKHMRISELTKAGHLVQQIARKRTDAVKCAGQLAECLASKSAAQSTAAEKFLAKVLAEDGMPPDAIERQIEWWKNAVRAPDSRAVRKQNRAAVKSDIEHRLRGSAGNSSTTVYAPKFLIRQASGYLERHKRAAEEEIKRLIPDFSGNGTDPKSLHARLDAEVKARSKFQAGLKKTPSAGAIRNALTGKDEAKQIAARLLLEHLGVSKENIKSIKKLTTPEQIEEFVLVANGANGVHA